MTHSAAAPKLYSITDKRQIARAAVFSESDVLASSVSAVHRGADCRERIFIEDTRRMVDTATAWRTAHHAHRPLAARASDTIRLIFARRLSASAFICVSLMRDDICGAYPNATADIAVCLWRAIAQEHRRAAEALLT